MPPPGTAMSSPRSAPSSPPASRMSSRRGSGRNNSCSTPAWASRRTPTTTGRCWPAWTGSSAWDCPCWSGRRARRSSAGCCPTPTAGRVRPRVATPPRWPRPCSRRRPVRGGSGCTTPPPPSTPSARSAPSEPLEEPAVPDRTPDRIAIRGLTAYAHHGVYAFERRQGQTFRVDAVLEVDIRPAAESDDLEKTVNYAELAKQLYGTLSGEPVDLLETLAQRLADVCLVHELVDAV